MLADQAKDKTDSTTSESGTFGADGSEVAVTEENADEFINYINNLSRGQ